MNKKPVLFATILLPALGAGLFAQSCSSGESVGTPTGSGGSSVSTGGSTSTTGTGGFTSATGTGGRTGTGGSTTLPGTGGSTVAGTGGSTIGGGTGGAATGGGVLTALNGYVMSGTWQGYAYTSTSGTMATVSPACNAMGSLACFTTSGAQLCAMGSVGADISQASTAQLAFGVNQPGSGAKGAATTAMTGISVTVSGYMPGMRVQIQDLAGTNRWCYNLTAATESIPWGMFNTKCYAPATGTAFTVGSMIADVGIVIPSQTAMATPFSFCLVDAHQY